MSTTYSDIPLDHLVIPIGGTFERSWPFDDVDGGVADWTDWSARSQIRDTFGGTLIATMSTDGDDGTIDLADNGNLTLRLPSLFTVDLSPIGNAVADLELTNPDGEVFRVMEYRVKITEEVTQ